MAITQDDLMQLSPLYISVFMLFTSLFNGDVKAYVWIGCIIIGISLIHASVHVNAKLNPKPVSEIEVWNDTPDPQNVMLLFSNYPSLSISTFFIIFTLMYLMIPMYNNNDWNYYVIFGFLAMFAIDSIYKLQHGIKNIGVVLGAVTGAFFSLLCCFIIYQAGGDKLLYYNTISSNNVYCSKPKKQQFKCYVYKNGEIISTV